MDTREPLWQRTPRLLSLAEDEVHVWRIAAQQPNMVMDQLRSVLSEAELQRSLRFYFEKDRQRSIITRGVVRILLAQYLAIQRPIDVTKMAKQLSFVQNTYGKPALDPALSPFSLEFNVSHSGDWIVFACSSKRPLGVDVEYMRANIEYEAIAERNFSPLEQKMLFSLPKEQQHEMFYRCWTRKEAYIKAIGLGLSQPLDEFSVSLGSEEVVAIYHHTQELGEVERWRMVSFEVAHEYPGAVMAEGQQWHPVFWSWEPPLFL